MKSGNFFFFLKVSSSNPSVSFIKKNIPSKGYIMHGHHAACCINGETRKGELWKQRRRTFQVSMKSLLTVNCTDQDSLKFYSCDSFINITMLKHSCRKCISKSNTDIFWCKIFSCFVMSKITNLYTKFIHFDQNMLSMKQYILNICCSCKLTNSLHVFKR